MNLEDIEKIKANILEKYKAKTSSSEKHFEEAKK